MAGIVPVFIPAQGSELYRIIEKGSGIVGQPYNDTETLCYFEGNIYGASNIVTWADRVHHAADRMAVAYPTVGKSIAREGELIRVGTFQDGRITLNTWANEQICDWLGLPDIQAVDAELEVSR